MVFTTQARLIKVLFKRNYDIALTDDQLSKIESVYAELRKDSMLDLCFFRFVNSALFLFITFLFHFFSINEKIIIILMIFTFYNIIHFMFNYLRYLEIKQIATEWTR